METLRKIWLGICATAFVLAVLFPYSSVLVADGSNYGFRAIWQLSGPASPSWQWLVFLTLPLIAAVGGGVVLSDDDGLGNRNTAGK